MAFSAQPNQVSLWDPYKVLDIHPLAGNFTCVGSAVTRGNARCRWGIGEARRQWANEALNAMGMRAPATDRNTSELLRSIATALLCLERHQYQIDERVKDWLRRIKEFLVKYNERLGLIARIKQLEEELGKYQQEQKRAVQVTVTPLNQDLDPAESEGLRQEIDRLRQELLNSDKARQKLEASCLESANRDRNLQSDTATQLMEITKARDLLALQVSKTEAELVSTKAELLHAESYSQEVHRELLDVKKTCQSLEDSNSRITTLKTQLEETTQNRASAQAAQISTLEDELKSTRSLLEHNQVELLQTKSRSQETADEASAQMQDLRQRIQTLQVRDSKNRLRDCSRVFQLSMWKGRCERLGNQITALSEQAERTRVRQDELLSQLSFHEVSNIRWLYRRRRRKS